MSLGCWSMANQHWVFELIGSRLEKWKMWSKSTIGALEKTRINFLLTSRFRILSQFNQKEKSIQEHSDHSRPIILVNHYVLIITYFLSVIWNKIPYFTSTKLYTISFVEEIFSEFENMNSSPSVSNSSSILQSCDHVTWSCDITWFCSPGLEH